MIRVGCGVGGIRGEFFGEKITVNKVLAGDLVTFLDAFPTSLTCLHKHHVVRRAYQTHNDVGTFASRRRPRLRSHWPLDRSRDPRRPAGNFSRIENVGYNRVQRGPSPGRQELREQQEALGGVCQRMGGKCSTNQGRHHIDWPRLTLTYSVQGGHHVSDAKSERELRKLSLTYLRLLDSGLT